MINSLFYYNLSKDSSSKLSDKMRSIREALKLSIHTVSRVSGIQYNTIDRIEKLKVSASVETIFPLIFFYGFSLSDFFDFDKQLPSADKLKAQLIKFHKTNGSDAYLKLFKDPKLIDLLEEELIPSGYFKISHDVAEVQQHCRDTYGYHYPSATGSLNTATEKGWLIKDTESSPMRYKQGPNAPKGKK